MSRKSGSASASGAARASIPARMQQALALHQAQQFDLAAELYEEILAASPKNFDALHLLGILCGQTGDTRRGLELMRQAVVLGPRNPAAHNNLGNLLKQTGEHAEAVKEYELAASLKPDYAEAHFNRGLALTEMACYPQAVSAFDCALRLNPGYADAYDGKGICLNHMGQATAALPCFDRAIELRPGFAEAHNNRGLALAALGNAAAAVLEYERAIAARPGFAEAYSNLGAALLALRDSAGAAQNCAKALELRPDFAEAKSNLGNALSAMGRYEEAIACHAHAVALKPELAEAHLNLGHALSDTRQYRRAIESYDRALELRPDYPFLFGFRLHTRMQICDWTRFDGELAELTSRIRRNEAAVPPFPLLALSDSGALQKQAAEAWSRQFRCMGAGTEDRVIARHDRIRIGYFSADFHNHATSYLMAELFERHDKSRFELIAFSFGPPSEDAMRQRIRASFDRFMELGQYDDVAVARLARELEIDIAVDLKGYTQDGRPGIFVNRAAPVQVSYLGYPGTLGLGCMDYLIADPIVVPEAAASQYTEKIVRLPGSYQVNDSTREIAEETTARDAYGLPAAGFVFCCFNNSYKVLPSTFDSWMRILAKVDGSVLWLLQDNPEASENLRREASRRGVDGARLVFAERRPLREHLARHRLADLFLDTFPYNAHTTASDALWTGLPVLTRAGESFASRVAASLLHAVGLSELAVSSQEAYESLAITLAQDRDRLAAIRRRLVENRLTAPLFDAQSFARNLEAAYTAMLERCQAGLPPEHL
ncbi:MAG TPA: tetratricopeptide repeat protein, partial [Rhodocyclaceae bacterium]